MQIVSTALHLLSLFPTTKKSRLHPNTGDFCCLTMDNESPLPPCWLFFSILVCHLHKCLGNQQLTSSRFTKVHHWLVSNLTHTQTNTSLMAHSLALDLNSVELQHLHSTHTKKILPPNRTWTCVVDSALRLFTLPPPCWRTRSNGGLARQWSYWNWQERIQRDGPSRPEAEVVEILICAASPCTNAQT